jgi:holo-[acyl-carrier protein] synthase
MSWRCNLIVGIGIDLVEVDRIEKILKNRGRRFISRIFTENEIDFCNQKVNAAECYAARFAAKEALAKALGHGLCEHFKWTDVEVSKESSGKPAFIVHGKTGQLVHNKRVVLSISHTKSLAVAMVVIESL